LYAKKYQTNLIAAIFDNHKILLIGARLGECIHMALVQLDSRVATIKDERNAE
jgi:hypothetical protein